MENIKIAFGRKSYILLLDGFFVCGFHVSFITNHFPSYLTDSGMIAEKATWSISLIGLFNVIGVYASGVLGRMYSKRNLLCPLYALRALTIGLFLIFPMTNLSVILFSSCMGLLWLSTVPLTSGLVGVMFRSRFLGSLYGFVLLSHQLRAFSKVLIGGAIYKHKGYRLVWVVAILLGLTSSLLHAHIEDKGCA